MFCQFPHEAVSPQKKGERFNQRCLSGIVVSDKNRMLSEPDKTSADTAKVLNL